MRVLGIETSCDETGVAVYDTDKGLLGHRLHSQIDLHAAYGGVVPELASRDHVRRLPLLLRETLALTGLSMQDVDAIAYTAGPGLAGALLVGSSVAEALGVALGVPTLPVHHLEGHLLSPLLSADPPAFPFVALLVSGGHTQLMRVSGVGDYVLLGETVDDAAGEAFDKTAKLIGLPYPGGPVLARLALEGTPGRFKLPRPMLHSKDFDFSFSGLKTAVLTTATRSRPCVRPCMAWMDCSKLSHSPTMLRAVWAKRCPASVRCSWRPMMSYSGMPTDSLISRSCIVPSFSAVDQSMIALKVIGLSHRPRIMVSRPASRTS